MPSQLAQHGLDGLHGAKRLAAAHTGPGLRFVEHAQLRVLNEAQPWACVRCSKPFGTVKAIEAMLGKLAGHAMFQGEALERLKMCSDCRVIDLYSAQNESKVTDL